MCDTCIPVRVNAHRGFLSCLRGLLTTNQAALTLLHGQAFVVCLEYRRIHELALLFNCNIQLESHAVIPSISGLKKKRQRPQSVLIINAPIDPSMTSPTDTNNVCSRRLAMCRYGQAGLWPRVLPPWRGEEGCLLC